MFRPGGSHRPGRFRSFLFALAPAGLALLAAGLGCAAPKQLYDGAPLPREKVALLQGMPDFRYTTGPSGKRNPVAGRGIVVIIGLDGKVFNRRVYSAYSGSSFHLLPGRHDLLAYCEYSPNDGGEAAVYYSALFTMSFTAQAGREYRYQAAFGAGADDAGRRPKWTGVWARPGVWDVTGDHSADASDRVSDDVDPVSVSHRTLTRIQAAVRGM